MWRKFLLHVDNVSDNCPVFKHQFLELCIHDYFYNHRRQRKEEGKRKDGCLVNDDNNKTETQWKLLHQPRVPLPPCCFLSYHAPNPLFRLVLRQISTYNRRSTSASQNGWKKSEHLLSKFPRIIHILVHRKQAALWKMFYWRRWESLEWSRNAVLLWKSGIYYIVTKVSYFMLRYIT
jgi:hypothetical protein